MSGPLSGFKVLDMSRVLAGPVATVLLADQGADVIKVEPLKGDVIRAMGGGGVTPGFLTANRGKRSIALDLKSEDGIRIVKRLAAEADVFVQNFRPGAIDGMGLGESVIREINPKIIYVSMKKVLWRKSLSHQYLGFLTSIKSMRNIVKENCREDGSYRFKNRSTALIMSLNSSRFYQSSWFPKGL